ncbi:PaaI family thioesterase [Nocardioides hungaricus]
MAYSSLSGDPRAETYDELVSAVRRMLDVLVETVPDPERSVLLAREVDALTRSIGAAGAPGAEPLAGHVESAPGRAHPILPQVHVDHRDDVLIRGRVVFSEFFHGAGRAAHGGAIALLFDEVLGRQVNSRTTAHCRTAYLHVDFRQLALVGAEHVIESRLDELDGRKQFASGRLWRDDVLVAEARGLFVHPR